MGKTVGVLGGEHSVSIGSARAHQKYYPDSTVLYLDAHADLRNEYMGTKWGHASGARRIHEQGNLVLVGVRSLCHEERLYIDSNDIKCVFWPSDDPTYMDNILEHLGEHVYLSVDLDVFDPSIMSAVGNPEPGGMNWQDVTNLIKYISDNRKIVGFDVSELSPDHGPLSCSYTASKLVYKILAYACRDKC
jgi:agmatinase